LTHATTIPALVEGIADRVTMLGEKEIYGTTLDILDRSRGRDRGEISYART
jgi:hypothetical protein